MIPSRTSNTLDVQHHSYSFNFVFEFGRLREFLETYSKATNWELLD